MKILGRISSNGLRLTEHQRMLQSLRLIFAISGGSHHLESSHFTSGSLNPSSQFFERQTVMERGARHLGSFPATLCLPREIQNMTGVDKQQILVGVVADAA